MKNSFFICLVLVFLTSFLSPRLHASSVVSAAAEAINRDLKMCLDHSEGVTVTMRDCYNTASQKMDKRLNDVYQQLLKKLNSDQQAKLKIAEKKWIDFRKAEADFSFAADPNAGGTLQLVNADDTYYTLLQKRVEELENYLKNLESH